MSNQASVGGFEGAAETVIKTAERFRTFRRNVTSGLGHSRIVGASGFIDDYDIIRIRRIFCASHG